MPVKASYPGVAIDKIPGPSATITGVATSIAAFLGRTPLGPFDQPIPCFSFADFATRFGGRHVDYPLSYAVEDFFLNGGGEAVIVRIDSKAEVSATASASVGGVTLSAASAGAWGNDLTLTAAQADADLFDLTVVYRGASQPATTEVHTGLTALDRPNRIDRVLGGQSALLRCAWPTNPGAAVDSSALAAMSGVALTGGGDGGALANSDLIGEEAAGTGLYALEKSDLFNLLCIPWDRRGVDIDPAVHAAAAAYCVRRRAVYIIDAPDAWAAKVEQGGIAEIQPADLGVEDAAAQRNSAVYFPKVTKPDPERGGAIDIFPACGIIAGLIAANDVKNGVWKAPAGLSAGLTGITGLTVDLTDEQDGVLNPPGINCLRTFPTLGSVVWGARTLRGADVLEDDYKYLPVRRLTLFIEESLYRGTRFAEFAPNDETLWSQLRLAVTGFMADLAKQGAFYGYQVACDQTTTTPADIADGFVTLQLAFAPVKPAEFIVLEIRQAALPHAP